MFGSLRSPFTAKFLTGGLGLVGVVALAWALNQDVESPGFLRAQTATPGALTCWGNDYGYAPPAGDWIQVTAGGISFGCAIRASDGTVECWGDNPYGNTNAPAGRFQKIDAGTGHICGIKEDGSVACWGANTYGQSTPPAGRFIDITASLFYSCGIKEDGTIVCWGQDAKGQLNAPAGTFVQLDAEGNHGCARKADGTVLCWGENVSGSTTPPAGTFRLVEVGYAYTCGIKTDETLQCWGYGGEGQTAAPTGTFSDVELGTNHACGLRKDGTIVCWGMNVGGQTNPPAGTFTDLAVGLIHGCAIGVSAGGSSSSVSVQACPLGYTCSKIASFSCGSLQLPLCTLEYSGSCGTPSCQGVCFRCQSSSSSAAATTACPAAWTQVTDMKFGTDPIYAVTYGNNKFVAVGYNGKGAYSTDGITWTAIGDMKFGSTGIAAITYGNNKFVAVGYNGKGAYSTDGITWTAIGDMKFGTTNAIRSVTYGNNKFVAVGTNGKGAYSADGITWTAIGDMKFELFALLSVTYGNNKFVAVGQNGKGSYSADGITWTAIGDMKFITTTVMTNTITSVAFGNGKFVATGYNGQGSYSSDGITWTAVPSTGVDPWSNHHFYGSTYGDGTFVAVGVDGSCSTDGITWTPTGDMKFDMSAINSVAFGNGKFVAVAQGGKGSYSGAAVAGSSSSAPSVSIVGSVQVPGTVFHGGTIVYRVTATNNGSQPLSQIDVYVQSAAANTFDATLSDARCVVGTGQQSVANCAIPTLAAGQSVTVDVGFRLGAGLSCSAVINSTVSVRSMTPSTVWNSELLLTPVTCTSSSSSVPTNSCTDSDGGMNLDVAGTVTSVTCAGSPPFCVTDTQTDYCDPRPGFESDITEQYCNGTTPGALTTVCTSGKICRNGACVTASSSSAGGQCTVGMQYGTQVTLTAANNIKASWPESGGSGFFAFRKANKDITLSRVELQGLSAAKSADAPIGTNGKDFDVVSFDASTALVIYEDDSAHTCKAVLVRWSANNAQPVIGAPVSVPVTQYNSWCAKPVVARRLAANKAILFWGTNPGDGWTNIAGTVATIDPVSGTISFGPVSQELYYSVRTSDYEPLVGDVGRVMEAVVRSATSVTLVGSSPGPVVQNPRWWARLLAWATPSAGGQGSIRIWARTCSVNAAGVISCPSQVDVLPFGNSGYGGVAAARAGNAFLAAPVRFGASNGVVLEGKGTAQGWGGTALSTQWTIQSSFYSLLPTGNGSDFLVMARDGSTFRGAKGTVGSSDIAWSYLSPFTGGKVAVPAGAPSRFLFFNYPDSNQTGQTTMIVGQYTDSCPGGSSSSAQEQACGNGQPDPGEQCGEPGLSCPAGQTCQNCQCVGGTSSSVAVVTSSSSRSSSASSVPVSQSSSSSSRSSSSLPATCGNAVLNTGEQCDTVGNLGCSAGETCQSCTACTRCGNFVLEEGEGCEVGIACSSSLACNIGTCRCETVLNGIQTQVPACGDFRIQPGEDCEEGITMPQPPCIGNNACNVQTCRCPAGTARHPRNARAQ